MCVCVCMIIGVFELPFKEHIMCCIPILKVPVLVSFSSSYS